MKVAQKIKQILAVLIAVIVFITSTGFNVYHYRCTTTNAISHTFFIDKTTFSHAEKQVAVEAPHSTSSCCGQMEILCEINYEEKECCDKFKTYHKVEIHNIFERLSENFEFTAKDVYLLTSLFDLSGSEESPDLIIDKESPPLLYGKELIYFIKKIKIPSKLLL